MQNGVLGEARAKAFLLDRFWVLERSVDVQGADYLIQRNTLISSPLDELPPRLGVVQVKFAKSGNTRILIKDSYLKTSTGEIAGEFFLLLLTGDADGQRMFLLSAQEIIELLNSSLTKPDRESFSASEIITSPSNYEVVSRKNALDRIQNALYRADYRVNRRYISALRDRVTVDQIAPMYQTELQTDATESIADAFYEQRHAIEKVVNDMEWVAEKLQDALKIEDPLELGKWLESQEFSSEVDGGGRLSFCLDGVFSDALIQDAEYICDVTKLLRSRNLETQFLPLVKAITQPFEASLTVSNGNAFADIRMSFCYDKSTMAITNVKHEIPGCSCTNEERSNCQHMEILAPGVLSVAVIENGRRLDDTLNHLQWNIQNLVGQDFFGTDWPRDAPKLGRARKTSEL